jgi:AraC-like DNA-binding protein
MVESLANILAVQLTLDQMAAIAHLSPYHFARQFKATTGWNGAKIRNVRDAPSPRSITLS